MKKIFVLFAVFASMILFIACGQQQPSEEKMVGTWVHPIAAGAVSINDEEPITCTNNEIITFNGDGTCVMGEYSSSSTIYEVKGNWKLSDDKTRIEFSFDGETSSIDIREFDGKSFITTSLLGNDFKFTKQ